MKFIGITGGVGAGKSKVLNMLSKLCDCRIIEADRVSEDMTKPGGLAYDKLREKFADDDIWTEDNLLDRPKAAKIIFSNDDKRQEFNKILHPAVKAYVLRESEIERVKGAYDYLFFEAALLIEDGYDRICDELWYIYTPADIRKNRLIENRGYSTEKIESIFATQLTEEQFREKCVREIDNSGNEEDLRAQLEKNLI